MQMMTPKLLSHMQQHLYYSKDQQTALNGIRILVNALFWAGLALLVLGADGVSTIGWLLVWIALLAKLLSTVVTGASVAIIRHTCQNPYEGKVFLSVLLLPGMRNLFFTNGVIGRVAVNVGVLGVLLSQDLNWAVAVFAVQKLCMIGIAMQHRDIVQAYADRVNCAPVAARPALAAPRQHPA